MRSAEFPAPRSVLRGEILRGQSRQHACRPPAERFLGIHVAVHARIDPARSQCFEPPVEVFAAVAELGIVRVAQGQHGEVDAGQWWRLFVSSEQAPPLPGVNFSVLALGDSNYPKFCDCGKNFDRRLEALGARRVYPRVDCDVDAEEPFSRWPAGVLPALAAKNLPTEYGTRSGEFRTPHSAFRTLEREHPGATAKSCAGSRSNPFPARLLTNRKLNGPGSSKDTRHLEISLGGSALSYEVGDALGVMPVNCPELVQDILRAVESAGEESVPDGNGGEVTLRDALMRHYEVTKITPSFLQAMGERAGDEALKRLSEPGANGESAKFLCGGQIIDLLLEFPQARLGPKELVGLLKKLQPRLYSIASSPKV